MRDFCPLDWSCSQHLHYSGSKLRSSSERQRSIRSYVYGLLLLASCWSSGSEQWRAMACNICTVNWLLTSAPSSSSSLLAMSCALPIVDRTSWRRRRPLPKKWPLREASYTHTLSLCGRKRVKRKEGEARGSAQALAHRVILATLLRVDLNGCANASWSPLARSFARAQGGGGGGGEAI